MAATLLHAQRPVLNDFPIGSYELPKDDDALRAMAKAGFNLVRCRNRADLDRAAAAGMLGWVPIPLQLGNDPKLRAMIEDLRTHPALGAWEGPDEIVWNFTAFSGLLRKGVHRQPDEWWRQTPGAVEYAEKEAVRVMPKLRQGAALVRQLDPRKRPIWINEAARSDMQYIRQYLDSVDITGCDIYPIHAAGRKPEAVGGYTDRYRLIGKGKPVWMVLQGFAWGELQGRHEAVAYPSFAESRLMAWDAIAHGARAVLYWGMNASKPQPAFRLSIYAIAAELAAVRPLLAAPGERGVRVVLVEDDAAAARDARVAHVCRRVGDEWLVAVVNEDGRPHMGVAVTGLAPLNGRRLLLLYGAESVEVRGGDLVTRLMPGQVKVFATSRTWETARRQGREYVP